MIASVVSSSDSVKEDETGSGSTSHGAEDGCLGGKTGACESQLGCVMQLALFCCW